jgi:hypothetical protein
LITTAATSLFHTTPLTNNTRTTYTSNTQATTQSNTQDATTATASGASPFAALPWAKLANAHCKNDPDAGRDARKPAEAWPATFSDAHNDELYAMLTGTYGGSAGGTDDGGGGGGDTPVLLPTMSPLAFKALDLLATACSPGTALLNLLQQDGGAGPTSLDICSASARQAGDGDLLSPSLDSLDRLIKQLRDDSEDDGHVSVVHHHHHHTVPATLGNASKPTASKPATPTRKRKNKHDPRGPAWHALDDKLGHMFTSEQLQFPTPEFRALLAEMSLTAEEDKRVKQLRRRNKCIEYSRANRRKNRLKKAGAAAASSGSKAPPPPKNGNLAVENVRLHEQLAALQQRIANIEHVI